MIICGIIRRLICYCVGLLLWIILRIFYWGVLFGIFVGFGKIWVEKWVLFFELIYDNFRIDLFNIIFLMIFFYWSVIICLLVFVGCIV